MKTKPNIKIATTNASVVKTNMRTMMGPNMNTTMETIMKTK